MFRPVKAARFAISPAGLIERCLADPRRHPCSSSGQQPGQSLAPSQAVDIGWHAFILHTVDYAAFCEQVAGRFVHHVPTDEADEMSGEARAIRERTLAAIAAAGYTVDEELWPDLANCSQCHAGCTDSPNSGKRQ